MSGRFVGFLVMTMTHRETRPMSRSEATRAHDAPRSSRSALARALGRASGNRLSDCSCGQQLDMCARAHCPRCGRSITQP